MEERDENLGTARLSYRGKNECCVYCWSEAGKKSPWTNYYTWYTSNFEKIRFIHMQEKNCKQVYQNINTAY